MKLGSNLFQSLWSYSIGFYGVWTAHIGRRLGLFEALNRKSLPLGELASSTGLYRPALEAWCSAALAYGFLTKNSSGKLRLRPGLAQILMRKSDPMYLGGQFSFLAERSLEYGGMEKLFKHGKVISGQSTIHAVEEATHWDHFAFIRALTRDRRLHRLMLEGCRFADIGCGTGSLISKLRKNYPRSTFLGIDESAKAVSVAQKALKGLDATIIRMRAEDLRMKAEFDVVYLGESLYAAIDKQRVISNCISSLKAGGTLVVLEGLMPARTVREDDMIIMGMQLDFALYGHKFMTKRELSELLKKAGFKAIKFEPLGGSVFLVTAMK